MGDSGQNVTEHDQAFDAAKWLAVATYSGKSRPFLLKEQKILRAAYSVNGPTHVDVAALEYIQSLLK